MASLTIPCVIFPRSELRIVRWTDKLDGVPSTVGTEYRAKNGQRRFCKLIWLSVCSRVITRLMTTISKIEDEINQNSDFSLTPSRGLIRYSLSPSVKLWNVFWFIWNDSTAFSSIKTMTSKCNGWLWISGSFNVDSSFRNGDFSPGWAVLPRRLKSASLRPRALM